MSTPAVTPQPTLAQAIRTKYPGVYDDMDDVTLESKILAKYPQYSDMPRTAPSAPNAGLAGVARPNIQPQEWQGGVFNTDPSLVNSGVHFGEPNPKYHPLPGSNKLDNYAGYVETGPIQAGKGAVNMAKGNIAKGGNQVFSGIGTTALPFAVMTAPAAPLATLRAVVGGIAGSKLASSGAQALGANPDQADLAGNIGGAAGGYAANKIPFGKLLSRMLLLGKTPAEAYQSALKPSTTLSDAERTQLAQTGIQEKIPVSQKGLNDLGDRIQALNDQIKQTIQSDPGRTINPSQAVKNLAATRQKFATQVNPSSDLQAIDSAGDEFLDQFRSQPGGAVRNMTADEAQSMKQGTYRALGDKAYGELKGASIEAQKALARGLKEELARQFPELNELNAKDSRLLDLQDSLERAVGRIGNHQLLGIGTPIATAGVRAVTNSNKLAAVAGVMKAILDNPAVKSRLAIALGNRVPIPIAAQRVENFVGSLGQLSSAPALPFLGSRQQPSANSSPYPSQ